MKTKGINHLALVCRDMAETVEFYTKALGMPLVKTVALPDGGQHFFFDCGGGSLLAFFWWPDAPPAAPGIASVKDFPVEPRSAVGSMNHVAFDMDEAELEASIGRLQAAGVHVSVPVVVNHDDSAMGVAREMHEGVWVRSVYFRDPNGVMLEFAATLRDFRPEDVAHTPGRAVEAADA
ncbi:VOC family protein [Phenylobacterium sp.]|uniref:VOC family protein n=1 Tax=Phenylobacterium sp. TaxID=1871053 RepID=UPI0025D9565B|nr:VOC family protein [Phenylobacterium sp.]